MIEIGIDRKRMCALNVSLWHPDYVVEQKKSGEKRADLLLYRQEDVERREEKWLALMVLLLSYFLFFGFDFSMTLCVENVVLFFTHDCIRFNGHHSNWLAYLAIVCCCCDWFPNVGYISEQLVGGLGMFNASFPSAARASAVCSSNSHRVNKITTKTLGRRGWCYNNSSRERWVYTV